MTRPKLHNREGRNRQSTGRPGASCGSNQTFENETQSENSDGINSLEQFLQAKAKKESEPMRTISFKLPESLFQKFERQRGKMSKTEYVLSLIEFADRSLK